jgi:hypothetical protein
LYSADYFYPVEVAHSFDVEVPAEILFHLQLYALASTLVVDPLRDLASARFQQVVERDWNTDLFPDAIRKVYEIATAGSQGEHLRSIVVNIAAEHAKELLGNGGRFSAMMGEVAEFGKDVFQVMAGGTITLLPLAAEKVVTYKCPVCPFEFFASAMEKEEIACPDCGVVNKEGEWRATKMEDVVNCQDDVANVKKTEVHTNGNGIAIRSRDNDTPVHGTDGKEDGVTAVMNGTALKQNGLAEILDFSLKDTIEEDKDGIKANENGHKEETKNNGVELKLHNLHDKGNEISGNGNGVNSSIEVKDTISSPKKKHKKSKKGNNIQSPPPPPPPPLEEMIV